MGTQIQETKRMLTVSNKSFNSEWLYVLCVDMHVKSVAKVLVYSFMIARLLWWPTPFSICRSPMCWLQPTVKEQSRLVIKLYYMLFLVYNHPHFISFPTVYLFHTIILNFGTFSSHHILNPCASIKKLHIWWKVHVQKLS